MLNFAWIAQEIVFKIYICTSRSASSAVLNQKSMGVGSLDFLSPFQVLLDIIIITTIITATQ